MVDLPAPFPPSSAWIFAFGDAQCDALERAHAAERFTTPVIRTASGAAQPWPRQSSRQTS